MGTINDILAECIKRGSNPRDIDFSDMVSVGAYQYRLLLSDVVNDGEILYAPFKQGLYIDGLFDTGMVLEDFTDARCTLCRCVNTVPKILQISEYNGDYHKVSIKNCSLSASYFSYLDNLDKYISYGLIDSSVYRHYSIPSPYGDTVPFLTDVIEDDISLDEDLYFRTDSRFSNRHTLSDRSNYNPVLSKTRMRGSSRRGEVWWVKNLEIGQNGDWHHIIKDHPVIVTGVSKGIASYYICTSNDIIYHHPKYRLKESINDGLTKEFVYVELKERQIEEEKLSNLRGFLTDTDMDVIFNPIKYDYQRYRFRSVNEVKSLN